MGTYRKEGTAERLLKETAAKAEGSPRLQQSVLAPCHGINNSI
jgi:hypothetical protein